MEPIALPNKYFSPLELNLLENLLGQPGTILTEEFLFDTLGYFPMDVNIAGHLTRMRKKLPADISLVAFSDFHTPTNLQVPLTAYDAKAGIKSNTCLAISSKYVSQPDNPYTAEYFYPYPVSIGKSYLGNNCPNLAGFIDDMLYVRVMQYAGGDLTTQTWYADYIKQYVGDYNEIQATLMMRELIKMFAKDPTQLIISRSMLVRMHFGSKLSTITDNHEGVTFTRIRNLLKTVFTPELGYEFEVLNKINPKSGRMRPEIIKITNFGDY